MTDLNDRFVKPDECVPASSFGLPLLVLATDQKYNFTDARKWVPLFHQTSGVCCYPEYMMATILEPRKEVVYGMHVLSMRWFDSQISTGMLINDESLLKRYRADLRELLSVDYSHEVLEEGLYPIDPTPEFITKLTEEKLPSNLDDLLIKDALSQEKIFWHLHILGPNSD